jgi:hypothetical protein
MSKTGAYAISSCIADYLVELVKQRDTTAALNLYQSR